ncbi:MAG TPA: DUF5684 domain-containing protein [Anaeromyxobacteraceae bacterium]|nr:DUF5684 domain-containing protein [Anaeromyxobacteraceae bacterium]
MDQLPAADVNPVVSFFYLVFLVLAIIGMWKTFSKAGLPGWGVLVPFYNVYLLMKLAGRPGWWLILALIPIVNIVIVILVSMDVARLFGKGAGFGFGILFLPFVFFPVLGFGDARYQGTAQPLPTTPVGPG